MLLGLGVSAVAMAATIPVGPTRTYTRIQDAVAVAADGDTLLIDPGTYDESLDISLDLTLQGAGPGAGGTIIDGDATDDVIRVYNDADVVIAGVTLRNGRRGLRVDTAAVTVTGSDIGPNAGNADGAGISAVDATVTMTGGRLVMDVTTVRGGGVYASNSDVTLDGTRIDGCGADLGAGLFIDGGTLELTDTVVVSNAAKSTGGGGVLQGDVQATLDGSVFASNSAKDGGGLAADGGGTTLDLADTSFLANKATGQAGGVRISGGATATSRRSTFAQQSAVTTGGGVLVTGSGSWSSVGDAFLGNEVPTGLGAALATDGAGTLSLAASTVAAGRARRGGGVYAATSGTVVLDGIAFVDNQATERGGAIAAIPSGSGAVALSNSRLERNRATSAGAAGGAVWASGGSVVLRNNQLYDNNAISNGGAAAFEAVLYLDVWGDRWCGNTAARGGAIHAANTGSWAFRNEALWDDRVTNQGGALYAEGGALVEIANSTFLANLGSDGGAVYLADVSANIHDTAIVGTTGGNGVSGASSVARTYTFTANALSTNFPQDLGGSVSGATLGSDTVTAAPQFAAFTANGDCHDDALWLQGSSPLVDAGSPGTEDPDGSDGDIGAYGGPDADPRWFQDTDGDGLFGLLDCDDRDANATAPSTWHLDADGDGYGGSATVIACDAPPGARLTGDDCDDAQAAVHPNAAEDCTATQDVNCDGSKGSVDSDGDGVLACDDCDDGDGTIGAGTDWFVDADGDGYGSQSTITGCALPGGASPRSGDCDDGDAARHPGAVESCTVSGDADCDGHDGTTDDDGDGYLGCQDCDDGADTTFPGAPDLCNDVDDDCDGTPDDAVDLLDPVFPDADGDGFGDGSAPVYSCDPPADAITDGTDCDDADGAIHPGAEDAAADGIDGDCDGVDPGDDTGTEVPKCGCAGVSRVGPRFADGAVLAALVALLVRRRIR